VRSWIESNLCKPALNGNENLYKIAHAKRRWMTVLIVNSIPLAQSREAAVHNATMTFARRLAHMDKLGRRPPRGICFLVV
jgi:hypothetical protein